MRKSTRICRPFGWLLFFALSLLLFRMPVLAQSKPALTEINDTLYRADGSVANGSLIISWPAFITADRESVAAGSKVIAVGVNGMVTTNLVPTAGATPAGSVYKVVGKMKDGTTFTEYWSVPATPAASIASMRVTPSTVSSAVSLDAAVAAVAKKLSGIQFTDPAGSQTGGIAEAYGACVTAGSGCTVVLRGDVSIASPQTISVTADRPFILDLAGHAITCTNSSGNCLTVANDKRTPWGIRNGRIAYGGTGTATGLKVDVNTEWGKISNVKVSGFDVGLSLYGAMENTFEDVDLRSNATALVMDYNSNANSFRRVSFIDNGTNLVIKNGTGSVFFSSCTVQGGTATDSIVIQSKGSDPNMSNIRFDQCHFEANGDGTANASAVKFVTDAGHYILNVTFSNSIFNAGSNGASGVVFRYTGSGINGTYLATIGNKYGGFTATEAGTPAGNRTSIGDDDSSVSKGSYDAGLNSWRGPGLTFNPFGTSHAYGVYGGSPSNLGPNGYLVFRDYTTGQNLLTYNGSTWNFPKDAWFNGTFGGARLQLTESTPKPTCAAGSAGTFAYTKGGAGVKDTVEICAKDASGNYAWRTLY